MEQLTLDDVVDVTDAPLVDATDVEPPVADPPVVVDTVTPVADHDPPPWLQRPLASLDLETTGTDPATSRCIEIAVVLVDADGRPADDGYLTLIDCGEEIPEEAVAVHGISTARMRTEGLAPAAAIAEVAARLRAVADEGIPVVIYNARFDWPLLLAEAQRVGIELPEVTLIDPMVIDRHLDRYRKGKRRLGDVAQHYGVDAGTAHSAYDDALASARIAQAIGRRFPQLGELGTADLHELQRGWFAEWRDGFNRFLVTKGSDDLVTGRWPY